jgi:endonuclease/exonuclease/phosphatase family metal-dependent hydrolase
MRRASLSHARTKGRAVGLALLLALAGCDPFHTGFDDVERAQSYRARTLTPATDSPAALLVMTYNIKFAGGRIDFFFDCFGDRVLMSKAEVTSHLSGLADKVIQVNPDVLILQEVDVNSKRSAHIDQLQWLLDHTDLNYGVYASQWKADFVPSDGIGAVDSGNAILSKYPLTDAERIALPLRSDQSGLERYFYLKRNVLTARLELATPELITIVATHSEAYAKDGTKQAHVEQFAAELDRHSAQGHWVIGAGDLNTLPPGSEKQFDFADSVCTDEDFVADDYRDESDLLLPLYDKYRPAIPLTEYHQDNTRHFTHTTDKNGFWNRKLDYIFSNLEVIENSGLTHQDTESGGSPTMPLSDHAPVSVELELP